ncbi:hypothetical protein BDDG_13547 [Blastomyces dermatitidis ATCC 18188]|uniref:Uncharacterized protein n=1 Tax=Ajellomyces dermatitidis (strain ATCC 18188 / CBS 674.68) TaxID=653446 RepID=A0A0J9ESZ1_AJEDA|nr:hypothetical protein BDDG_13547 [Blastomyces dermatitidis ATCC 18188]
MKKLQNFADSTQQYSEQSSGSYTTVLAGGGGGVTMAAGGAEDGPDADAPTDRTAAAAREAGGGVTMGAVLPQLIDTAASNLAFLMIMEATAAS